MGSRVLVVEDYPDLRSAIVAALDRANYDCVGAATRDDAIRKLKSRKYSAIVLDPVADIGSDPVMIFLREQQPEQVPNVVVLGDEGLSKPFDTADLVARLPINTARG
jgi:DNA-binding response OmpR family regulator